MIDRQPAAPFHYFSSFLLSCLKSISGIDTVSSQLSDPVDFVLLFLKS